MKTLSCVAWGFSFITPLFSWFSRESSVLTSILFLSKFTSEQRSTDSRPWVASTIIYEAICFPLLSAISLWNIVMGYWFSWEREWCLTQRKIPLAEGAVNKSTSSDSGRTSCSLNEPVLVHHHKTNEIQKICHFRLKIFYFMWNFKVLFLTINQVISDLKIHTNWMNKCLVKGIKWVSIWVFSPIFPTAQRIA